MSDLETLFLRDIVHNVAYHIHSDFTNLLQSLTVQPDERIKREQLVRFFETRRQQLTRLLAVVRWVGRSAAIFSKLPEISRVLIDYETYEMALLDTIKQIQQNTVNKSSPHWDILGALHVLSEGTYRLLPRYLVGLHKPTITPSLPPLILARLDHMLRCALVSLPPITNPNIHLAVKDGVLYMMLPHVFVAALSLRMGPPPPTPVETMAPSNTALMLAPAAGTISDPQERRLVLEKGIRTAEHAWARTEAATKRIHWVVLSLAMLAGSQLADTGDGGTGATESTEAAEAEEEVDEGENMDARVRGRVLRHLHYSPISSDNHVAAVELRDKLNIVLASRPAFASLRVDPFADTIPAIVAGVRAAATATAAASAASTATDAAGVGVKKEEKNEQSSTSASSSSSSSSVPTSTSTAASTSTSTAASTSTSTSSSTSASTLLASSHPLDLVYSLLARTAACMLLDALYAQAQTMGAQRVLVTSSQLTALHAQLPRPDHPDTTIRRIIANNYQPPTSPVQPLLSSSGPASPLQQALASLSLPLRAIYLKHLHLRVYFWLALPLQGALAAPVCWLDIALQPLSLLHTAASPLTITVHTSSSSSSSSPSSAAPASALSLTSPSLSSLLARSRSQAAAARLAVLTRQLSISVPSLLHTPVTLPPSLALSLPGAAALHRHTTPTTLLLSSPLYRDGKPLAVLTIDDETGSLSVAGDSSPDIPFLLVGVQGELAEHSRDGGRSSVNSGARDGDKRMKIEPDATITSSTTSASTSTSPPLVVFDARSPARQASWPLSTARIFLITSTHTSAPMLTLALALPSPPPLAPLLLPSPSALARAMLAQSLNTATFASALGLSLHCLVVARALERLRATAAAAQRLALAVLATQRVCIASEEESTPNDTQRNTNTYADDNSTSSCPASTPSSDSAADAALALAAPTFEVPFSLPPRPRQTYNTGAGAGGVSVGAWWCSKGVTPIFDASVHAHTSSSSSSPAASSLPPSALFDAFTLYIPLPAYTHAHTHALLAVSPHAPASRLLSRGHARAYSSNSDGVDAVDAGMADDNTVTAPIQDVDTDDDTYTSSAKYFCSCSPSSAAISASPAHSRCRGVCAYHLVLTNASGHVLLALALTDVLSVLAPAMVHALPPPLALAWPSEDQHDTQPHSHSHPHPYSHSAITNTPASRLTSDRAAALAQLLLLSSHMAAGVGVISQLLALNIDPTPMSASLLPSSHTTPSSRTSASSSSISSSTSAPASTTLTTLPAAFTSLQLAPSLLPVSLPSLSLTFASPALALTSFALHSAPQSRITVDTDIPTWTLTITPTAPPSLALSHTALTIVKPLCRDQHIYWREESGKSTPTALFPIPKDCFSTLLPSLLSPSPTYASIPGRAVSLPPASLTAPSLSCSIPLSTLFSRVAAALQVFNTALSVQMLSAYLLLNAPLSSSSLSNTTNTHTATSTSTAGMTNISALPPLPALAPFTAWPLAVTGQSLTLHLAHPVPTQPTTTSTSSTTTPASASAPVSSPLYALPAAPHDAVAMGLINQCDRSLAPLFGPATTFPIATNNASTAPPPSASTPALHSDFTAVAATVFSSPQPLRALHAHAHTHIASSASRAIAITIHWHPLASTSTSLPTSTSTSSSSSSSSSFTSFPSFAYTITSGARDCPLNSAWATTLLSLIPPASPLLRHYLTLTQPSTLLTSSSSTSSPSPSVTTATTATTTATATACPTACPISALSCSSAWSPLSALPTHTHAHLTRLMLTRKHPSLPPPGILLFLEQISHCLPATLCLLTLSLLSRLLDSFASSVAKSAAALSVASPLDIMYARDPAQRRGLHVATYTHTRTLQLMAKGPCAVQLIGAQVDSSAPRTASITLQGSTCIITLPYSAPPALLEALPLSPFVSAAYPAPSAAVGAGMTTRSTTAAPTTMTNAPHTYSLPTSHLFSFAYGLVTWWCLASLPTALTVTVPSSSGLVRVSLMRLKQQQQQPHPLSIEMTPAPTAPCGYQLSSSPTAQRALPQAHLSALAAYVDAALTPPFAPTTPTSLAALLATPDVYLHQVAELANLELQQYTRFANMAPSDNNAHKVGEQPSRYFPVLFRVALDSPHHMVPYFCHATHTLYFTVEFTSMLRASSTASKSALTNTDVRAPDAATTGTTSGVATSGANGKSGVLSRLSHTNETNFTCIALPLAYNFLQNTLSLYEYVTIAAAAEAPSHLHQVNLQPAHSSAIFAAVAPQEVPYLDTHRQASMTAGRMQDIALHTVQGLLSAQQSHHLHLPYAFAKDTVTRRRTIDVFDTFKRKLPSVERPKIKSLAEAIMHVCQCTLDTLMLFLIDAPERLY